MPTRSIIKAKIEGGPLAPHVRGEVVFMPNRNGTTVSVEVTGLPEYQPATETTPQIAPFGFHIHDMGVCIVGDSNDPFESAMGHWNPDNQPHGNHAGDFPVLFSNHGRAKMTFFTDRFKPNDVVGLSVMIHQSPNDYRTQPSGNSGKRLACGVIKRYYLR